MKSESFITVETVHHASVDYWWTDESLHDSIYNIAVHDAMDEACKAAELKYGVMRDTRFCTQFEGVAIVGSDLIAVQKAAKDIATVLSRFKKIRPLR